MKKLLILLVTILTVIGCSKTIYSNKYQAVLINGEITADVLNNIEYNNAIISSSEEEIENILGYPYYLQGNRMVILCTFNYHSGQLDFIINKINKNGKKLHLEFTHDINDIGTTAFTNYLLIVEMAKIDIKSATFKII